MCNNNNNSYERFYNPTSFWKPYFDALPTSFPGMPFFYSPAEKRLLTSLSLEFHRIEANLFVSCSHSHASQPPHERGLSLTLVVANGGHCIHTQSNASQLLTEAGDGALEVLKLNPDKFGADSPQQRQLWEQQFAWYDAVR